MPENTHDINGDLAISNVETDEEMVADEISTGEGTEAAPDGSDNGFEVVKGYTPPAAPKNMIEMDADGLSASEGTTQFRDIGEASFGPPGPVMETVHGTDDRVQINNTSVYPWRVHSSLRITAADGSMWIGTGWFVGPRILVTAGHVVYIKGSGVPGRDGWVKKIVVMPGRNGSQLPYGSVTSSQFWTVKGWANNGNSEYDYGAIILRQNLGNRTGWLGFGNWPNLNGIGANISGYPGDKPAGTQWYAARNVDSSSARKVYYDIDTAGGQSGSAVYRFYQGGRYGIAVHAYGGSRVNSGTRINAAVFNNIKAWRDGS
jgi:glutamyl endopeptidase